ncbi:hypothetical protein V6Z11_A10G177700 [Gossypium hirsutum]
MQMLADLKAGRKGKDLRGKFPINGKHADPPRIRSHVCGSCQMGPYDVVSKAIELSLKQRHSMHSIRRENRPKHRSILAKQTREAETLSTCPHSAAVRPLIHHDY